MVVLLKDFDHFNTLTFYSVFTGSVVSLMAVFVKVLDSRFFSFGFTVGVYSVHVSVIPLRRSLTV